MTKVVPIGIAVSKKIAKPKRLETIHHRTRTFNLTNGFIAGQNSDLLDVIFDEVFAKTTLIHSLRKDNLPPIAKLSEGMTQTRQFVADILNIQIPAAVAARIVPSEIGFQGMNISFLGAFLMLFTTVTKFTDVEKHVWHYNLRIPIYDGGNLFVSYVHKTQLEKNSSYDGVLDEVTNKFIF